VYSLVVAKSGPKNLTPSTKEREGMVPQGMSLVFMDYSMQALAELLAMLPPVQRPVTDKTGLKGYFDFMLRDVLPSATNDVIAAKFAMSQWDTLFTDIQQLGLRLEPGTGPIETLVIDHAELPRGQ
jgi:uncharacterized protein (TIGR03435 family)